MTDDEDLAEINYDDVLARKPNSILFLIEAADPSDPAWKARKALIPISQIKDYTRDLLDTTDVNTGPGSFFIPQWLAEEKDLV